MSTNMDVSIRYSTHLPLLIEVMKRTSGDVLELGPGVFSTPFLHWRCEVEKRNLLTIESDRKWFNFCRQYYRTPYHKFLHVKKWDDAKEAINKEWDVAFIDHSPSRRRVVEIAQLANLAKYIVIHDSEERKDYEYHYPSIYPLFKYRFDLGEFNGIEIDHRTTILSNFIDLKEFKLV